jgi:Bifunctional DNA primase/polymerase, N-terminal
MTESVYDIFAPKYVARGLHPLPIGPGTKKPMHWVPSLGKFENMVNWSDPRRPVVTPPQPGAGIGVRLGIQSDGTYLIAFDWDSDDAATEAMSSTIFPQTVTKWGGRGFTAFYRSKEPVATRSFKIGGRVALQILSDGTQTVVPPTIHPDTKQPYAWGGKYQLFDLLMTDLPALPQ